MKKILLYTLWALSVLFSAYVLYAAVLFVFLGQASDIERAGLAALLALVLWLVGSAVWASES